MPAELPYRFCHTAALKVEQRKAKAGQNQVELAKELAELQKQLEKCNADRFANVELLMDGQLERDVYQSRRAELSKQAEKLEAKNSGSRGKAP